MTGSSPAANGADGEDPGATADAIANRVVQAGVGAASGRTRVPEVPEDAVRVGRVVEVLRYPVKSMAGESLRSGTLAWHGLAGDRRWAFVRPHRERSGFPWLTIRECPQMSHYRPALTDPARPDGSSVTVTTANGQHLDVLDPRLAAELGEGVRVMKQDRGVFDAMPISLITTQSIEALERRLSTHLGVLRFRPNLVVEAADARDEFPEDSWVGGILRIGSAMLRLDQPDGRCVMVNVNPTTLERDPRVLRTIATERGADFGVYGSTVQPGSVTVGDPVHLLLESGPEWGVRRT